jgi:putative heme iron utilization protein
MNPAMARVLREILQKQDVAALGTLHEGEPSVSMVPYVVLTGGRFAIHVSDLASHTRDMREHAGVSLMIVAPEAAGVPPQARARVTIQGSATEVGRSGADHAAMKTAYVARFPQSEGTFGLADFSLFGIQPRSVRFIAGFDQAVTLTPEAFQAELQRDA